MIILKIILLIVLAFIIFVLLIQIQMAFVYNQEPSLSVGIAFFKIQIIPKKNDKTAKKKKIKSNKDGKVESKKEKKEKKKLNLTIEDILDAIPYIYNSIKRALRATRSRIKIDPFNASVCFANDDPSITARNYGRASALMWTIMPDLEKRIRIPNPSIHLDVNYQENKTQFTCSFGLKIRIIDVLCIGVSALIPILKLLIRFAKNKKRNIENK